MPVSPSLSSLRSDCDDDQLQSEPDIYLGLDIGGTKTLGALRKGDTVLPFREQAPAQMGNKGVVATAVAVTRSLLESAGISPSDLAGIGIGIPGVVDENTGVVSTAVNLQVEELPLKAELEDRLGVPVVVANDVNVAALGAASALGLSDGAAFLNIGTGMAASLVQNGRNFQGTTGIAGEIGHCPVDPNGFACGCGQIGCLETIASGSAIARRWPVKYGHPSDDLLAAHLEGDVQATVIFEELAQGIAQAIRMIVLTYDPAWVILGGGMRRLGEPLLEEIDRVFERWASASPFLRHANLPGRLRVLPEDCDAGAEGAALLAEVAFPQAQGHQVP